MAGKGCRCQELVGDSVPLHPKCFGEVWLFQGTPPEAWDSLSDVLVRRKLNAGEILFHQDDEAQSMFLVKAGTLKLWKVNEDGRTITLDIRKAGDLLGENVLIEEQGVYPVSATSMEPTLVCGIDKPTFERLVTDFPTVGLAVIRNLSRRVEYLSGTLGALSEPTIEDRLYKVLWSVADEVGKTVEGGKSIAFPLTHEEIGFLVGAHRVSVTKALGNLKESGKIRIDGKLLFIASSF